MDKRKQPIHFIAMDGLCQYEIREAFGISEIALPNVAVVLPMKQKGARLVGTFNSDDISGFIEGVLRGKVETVDVGKLNYQERDCKSIGANTQGEEEDDEILREILREAEGESEEKLYSKKKGDTKRGRKKGSSKKSGDL